ncbi:lipoprotein [Lysobacter helvus]|uniref:Lipoprotein n=2 Tax=Lysobacteraceae TaxID=32033 RepID=A0ABN6FP22_9GAMM|nr:MULTISPECIES: peptidoglycan DD-metalloendopeptidase family protein [Lysobacter]BCT91342.1 lipoprotein [Lysobacter caseinilyticus]BCT94495.1 lipoprotein [Lysobacter helvus]
MRLRARLVLQAACVAVLAACGSSHVVRRAPTSSPPPRVAVAKPGEVAVVNRGDTLYGIAFRNGIDVRDLARWNGIGPPYTIHPGQQLRLYPGSRPSSRPATATAGTASRPPATSTQTPRPAPPPRPVAPPPPAVSPITWTWPASGGVLSSYVAGEPTKQGIDIAGDNGAPVRAAGDGVVVYSGAGLVGYGELIIVKHNDAWLSAYGHNRRRLVNEGQLVQAGQQIAEMGHSGAARDMLHFEIRYNGKPVDPLVYLPKR